MQPSTIYISSAYLAPVQYYSKLLQYDTVRIEQYENYTKQTYRNRCIIAAPGGPLTLSIPILHSEGAKCLMKDIRISDHGNWRRLHWNALETAYGNTPFFEYYKDDFRPFYEDKKYPFLIDFNEALCRLVCELADISFAPERTSEYKTDFTDCEYDFREVIHPKKDPQTADPGFTPRPYYQVFDNRYGFIPNLSIIDLLFNMGPETLQVL